MAPTPGPSPWGGRFGAGRRATVVVLGMAAALLGAALLAGAVPPSNQGAVATVRTGPEVPATAMNLGARPANNSPLLLADPTESRFVVLAHRLDAPTFGCALQVSGDGGQSWLPTRPIPELPEGAERCYAPEVAFDPSGVLYYLFVGLQGEGNSPMGVFLITSSDRGQTFSPPRLVLGAHHYQVRMAIEPSLGPRGRLHLVWLQAGSDPPLGGLPPPPNPIMAAYSDDGAQTLSTPVQINDAERELAVAPALALGPDQRVHVGYYDLRDDVVDYRGLEGPRWPGTWSLVVSTSTDGGERFAAGRVVDDQIVPPERVMLIFTMPPPSLVADSDGDVYAAWHDARNGDWDAFVARSPDAGSSWDEPRRLNDDAIGNGRHQYLPRLAVSAGGRLDAAFYDRRADVENIETHVSFTFSTDGGSSFARNQQLTSAPSYPEVGQRYSVVSAEGLVEFGARLGLLSRPSTALAAWTDTRNASAARFTTEQDIFTSEVTSLPVLEPGWVRPVGVVLVAAGLGAIAAGAWLRRRGCNRLGDAVTTDLP